MAEINLLPAELEAMKKLEDIFKNDINRYTETHFKTTLLPILQQQDKINVQAWLHYSAGPFRWISVVDDNDSEKELFRIPPIIPTYKMPTDDVPSIDRITDKVHNSQHLGPYAARLLDESLTFHGDKQREAGMLDEEATAWKYIFDTYVKPTLDVRGKDASSTQLPPNSNAVFQEDEI